jgi:hypothetical protein
MCAFDLLPAAVHDADHNWSAREVRQEMRRTKAMRKACMRDAGVVVAFIADQDKRKHDADAQAGRVAEDNVMNTGNGCCSLLAWLVISWWAVAFVWLLIVM